MNRLSVLLTLLFIASNITKAQDTIDEKIITKKNSEYFKLERENIHTQFNKTVYTTEETIWLKGYIVDKITNLPNIKSSNVIMEIFNSKGEKIDSKLLYSENSTFNGYYKTDNITQSDRYYFRFFTNYMNNFTEDESSSYEITIINPTNYNSNLLQKFNVTKLNINYFPESGVLLENADNSIVVEIKDCNGIGSTIQNIEVVDDKNKEVTNFSTNQHGIGKFKLLNIKDANYKIRIQDNNVKITEKVIEKPSKSGYIISINDNYNSETLFVEIRTNSNTLTKKQPIWLGIQYLSSVSLIKICFDDNSPLKKLAFSKKELNHGINNFVLLNERKEILSERLYYNHNSSFSNALEVTGKIVTNDSIKYKFKSNLKLGEVSYSVLPSKTYTNPNKYTIYSSLLINNHISKGLNNSNYYLNDYNRLKHFELDNALFSAKYKYSFLNNINLPTEKFNSENGLTLTGKINSLINNKEYKVSLLSITSGKRINTDINEKNEFRFENLIVDDSTSVHLTLVNKKNEAKEFASTFNLIKAKNVFFKPINLTSYCTDTILKKDTSDLDFPVFYKNTHMLDSIRISKTRIKEPKLVNNKNSAYLSTFVDGYKITDDLIKNHGDVLSFLRSKGYDIATTGGDVTIVTRSSRSFNQSREPSIMIDNAPIADVNYLFGMRMEGIDEIYINKRGYGAGSAGRNGVISIFTKKTHGGKINYKSPSKNYICEGGFVSYVPFKSNFLINFKDKSFVNFGSVFWNSKANTNENGNFEITIPRINNEELIIVLDGINSTGQVISKTITLQP